MEPKPDHYGSRVSAQVNLFYTIICDIFDHLDESDVQDILECYDEEEEEDEFEGPRSEDIKRRAIYRAVRFGQDHMKAAVYFLDVIQKLNLHASDGQEFVELEAFIEEMQKDGILPDEVFVGRDKDVKKLVEKIKSESHAFGISISAIGGQGKSIVAKHVCRKIREEGWRVIKVDLREKSTVGDIVQSLLVAAGQTSSWNANLSELWTFMEQINERTLFCLDDFHSFLEDQKYTQKMFLEDLLKKIYPRQDKPIMKFLMTTRRKLNLIHCENIFVEYELRPLEIDDAVELLKRCSEKDDFEDEIEYSIVNECARSPLGISVVAELIKNEKFTPKKLLFNLKNDQRNVTEALKMNTCLKQSIEYLDVNLQKCVLALSVFQSQAFTLRNARRLFIDLTEDAVNVMMNSLCEAHLLNKEDTQSNEYYLHPLVYRYLKEWKLSKEMQDAFDSAIRSFVELYEEIISKIVKKLDSYYMKGISLLKKHKSHLIYFYDILLDKKDVLKPYEKGFDERDVIIKKSVSDLADHLLSDVKKMRLCESEATRAKSCGNEDMHFFWTVEHANVIVIRLDKPDIGMELLHSLRNILDDMKRSPGKRKTPGKLADYKELSVQKSQPPPQTPTLPHRAQSQTRQPRALAMATFPDPVTTFPRAMTTAPWTLTTPTMISTSQSRALVQPEVDIENLELDLNVKRSCSQGHCNLQVDGCRKPLLRSLFHNVKGLSLWKLQNFDDAIKHFRLALTLIDKCRRKKHSCFIAEVYCAIGEVQLQKGNLDEAKDDLKTGLLIIRDRLLFGRSGNNGIRKVWEEAKKLGDDMRLINRDRDLHRDIPRFFTNLGNLYLKRARLPENKANKKKDLDLAQKHLDYGMDIDRQLKLDKFDEYYEKMKLRADVFIEKGLLMEALKDSETASDCRRLILQPPHLHYTESVYQLALVFMLIGISNADKNSEEARQNWDTSSAYFSELEENHLIDGGIPLNHPLFQEIKENHLKISELQEDETMKSRVKKLYEKLESGGFETNVKKGLKDFKKMSYTVKEIMQMMFKSGPSHFGEMEPVVEKIENDVDHQMERLMRKVPECNDSDSSCDLEGYISSEGSSNSDMERSDCYGCGTSSSDSDL